MINIVIADDSDFFRYILIEQIEKSGKIKVVGAARDGKEAITMVRLKKPDLVILDYQMPVMNGLQCLRHLKKEFAALPIFMLSALTYEGAEITIKALEYGAVDFALKPGGGRGELNKVISSLVERIQVIVFKERLESVRRTAASFQTKDRKVLFVDGVPLEDKVDVIVVGSSVGGVQAMMDILPKLPPDTKPIVWAQHMPKGFTTSLAKRLDELSMVHVVEAKDRELIKPGVCYIAPGGFQTYIQVNKNVFRTRVCSQREKNLPFSPSCNFLFESAAQCYGARAVGIILSGMGDDGTDGLKKMHGKEAFIIGQKEESCSVYGMPKAAFKSGVVNLELGVNEIIQSIIQMSHK